MPKVTDAHIEARRQQILDAARACFSRKGFHQTTMHDICQEAELSPGAVYRYFPSKEDIIATICSEADQRNRSLIKAIEERGSTLQVLEELADTFFSLLDNIAARESMCVDIELWSESLSNPRIGAVMQRGFENVCEPLAEIVRRAQARGEINPSLDADATAQVLLSFFEGLVLQKALDSSIDVWKYVAVVKAMMGGSFWLGAERDRRDQ